jgi:serine/threonine protein kinase
MPHFTSSLWRSNLTPWQCQFSLIRSSQSRPRLKCHQVIRIPCLSFATYPHAVPDWHINPKDVVPLEMIAHGPKVFATSKWTFMYLAKYKGITVVVKSLHPDVAVDPKMRELLISEIESSMQLKHPNISKVFGGWGTYDEEKGIDPSIVEEYAPLKFIDVISNPKKYKLTTDQKKDIIRQLIECLPTLHAYRPPVYHCDLKPENILLTEDFTIKLNGFSILKDEELKPSSLITGYSSVFGFKRIPGFRVCSIVRSLWIFGVHSCRHPRCSRTKSTSTRICLRWA